MEVAKKTHLDYALNMEETHGEFCTCDTCKTVEQMLDIIYGIPQETTDAGAPSELQPKAS